MTGLNLEKLDKPIPVYNLDVEDFDTYFVGSGVLVHNRCKKPNEDSPTFERMGKSKGNTPRNNKVQNRQVRNALTKLGIKDKKFRERIHNTIHGQGGDFQEILKVIEGLDL